MATNYIQGLLQQASEFSQRPVRGEGGVQMAQAANQIAESRARLEQAKEAMQMEKINSVTNSFELAANAKDPKTRNFLLKNVVPGKIKALGLEKFFNPQTLEMIQTSPEALDKFRGLKIELEGKVMRGEMDAGQAYSEFARIAASDPEEIVALDTDRFTEAEKFSLSEGGKSKRVQLQGQIGLGKQMQAQAATPQVVAATGVAKEFADYQAAGGKATLDKNLARLEEAAKKLESGEVKTGKLSAAVPGLSSDVAQDVLNPEIAAVRDEVRGAVQATLRQTLGAQFTQQEGEAIFNRSFNPRLSAEENAKRIRTEIKGLRQTIKNKEAEFAKQGLIPAAKSDAWKKTLSANKQKIKSMTAEDKKSFMQTLSQKLDVPIEEIMKELGE